MKKLMLTACLLFLGCSNSSNPVSNTTIIKQEGDLYLVHFKNYGLTFGSNSDFYISIPTNIIPGGIDSTTVVVFPLCFFSTGRWEYPTMGALFGMPYVYMDSVNNGACSFHYSDSGVADLGPPYVKLTKDTIFQHFGFSIVYDPDLVNGGDTLAAVGPSIRKLVNTGFETFIVKHPTILDN
jgi:hypothetical protein